MNCFQSNLMSILCKDDAFKIATYIGRACYVKLKNGMNVKIELAESLTGNEFDILQLTAISGGIGTVDKIRLYFDDYVREKASVEHPHLYYSRSTAIDRMWWKRDAVPTPAQVEALARAAGDYLRLFATMPTPFVPAGGAV